MSWAASLVRSVLLQPLETLRTSAASASAPADNNSRSLPLSSSDPDLLAAASDASDSDDGNEAESPLLQVATDPLPSAAAVEDKRPGFAAAAVEGKPPVVGAAAVEGKPPVVGAAALEGKPPVDGAAAVEGKPPVIGAAAAVAAVQQNTTTPFPAATTATEAAKTFPAANVVAVPTDPAKEAAQSDAKPLWRSMRKTKIFPGSGSSELTDLITKRLGLRVSNSVHDKFANRETNVIINESIREDDVYIVQTGGESVNDRIMELVITISACKLSSAKRVTAVIPFFFYSKQCKKKNRSAITAKLVADMLAVAGVDHIMTMDLHASAMQGFFSVPTDNLLAEPVIANYIRHHVADYKEGVVVAKNPGAAKRVTSLADRLDVRFALIYTEKLKGSDGTTKSKTSRVVGDVKDRICFIADDMIDGMKSFRVAAQTLMSSGATRVYLVATHGVFSGESLQQMHDDPNIHKVIVTNTVPVTRAPRHKIEVIDVSPVLAEAIRRTHNGESISYLFNHVPE